MIVVSVIASLYLAPVIPHAVVTAWVLLGGMYIQTYRGCPSRTGHRAVEVCCCCLNLFRGN
jgi:hypothetical protein